MATLAAPDIQRQVRDRTPFHSDRIVRFYDSRISKVVAKVLPGHYYTSDSSDEILITTLGSCVSACVRDPEAGVGGMNHFMLPGTFVQGGPSGSGAITANCYGVFAMESLINEILMRGGRRSRLEIKITGAGHIGWGTGSVSESNARFILKFLSSEGFEPLATDLGGSQPRKVQYEPLSGKLRIKKLMALRAGEILEQELKYQQQIKTNPVAGTVELF